VGRAEWISAVFGVVVICGQAVVGFVRDPMALRRADLDERLAAIEAKPIEVETFRSDRDELKRTVVAKPALWKPLYERAKRQKPAPDLAKILGGVRVLRGQVGEKIRIVDDDRRNPRGKWMQKGDTLRGVLIKEITPTEVIFSKTQDGKEYTHAVPRP